MDAVFLELLDKRDKWDDLSSWDVWTFVLGHTERTTSATRSWTKMLVLVKGSKFVRDEMLGHVRWAPLAAMGLMEGG
jgi:hypothetical protein